MVRYRVESIVGDDLDADGHGAGFDPAGSSVSFRVVDAAATYLGVDHLDLDPLYPPIDPDALDSLFAPPLAGTTDTVEFCFEYEGLEIPVTGDGTIRLAELS